MVNMNDHESVIYGTHFPNRLFVGCLPEQATATNIAEFFSQYGTVLEAKVVLDQNGRSKRFGFLNFVSTDDVCSVLRNAPIIFMGKRINIGRAVKKEDEEFPSKSLQISNRLFVGSLHYKVTANVLAEYFGKYGKVLEAKVVLDEYGRSKRFGFIYFDSEETKKKVLTAKPIYLKGKRINISDAIKKEKTTTTNKKVEIINYPSEDKQITDLERVCPAPRNVYYTTPSTQVVLLPVLQIQVPNQYSVESYLTYDTITNAQCQSCHQINYSTIQDNRPSDEVTGRLTVAESLNMVLNSGKKDTTQFDFTKYNSNYAEISYGYGQMKQDNGLQQYQNNTTLHKRLS